MAPKAQPLAIARVLSAAFPLTLLFGPAVSDVALCVIALLFLGHCYRAKEWQWLRTRWVQFALLFVGYLVIRNLFNPAGPGMAVYALAWLRLPLFAAALAYAVLPDPWTERWMLRALLVTTAFLALDTLWQFMHGVDLLGHAIYITDGFPRMTGPFSGPRVGITLAWLIFPALAWLVTLKSPPAIARVAGVVLAVAAGLAIYVSGERMAMLLFIGGVGLMLLALKQGRRYLVLAALLAALLGWQLTQTHEVLGRRQVGATSETVGGFWGSVYGRTWLSAVHVAQDHPMFGVGVRQFQPRCVDPKYGPNGTTADTLRCPLHPHNFYLGWLAESGVVGLGLLSLMLGSWAWLLVTRWRQWWGNPVATGLVVALVVKLAPFAVTPNHWATWALVPLWLLAGWLIAHLRLPQPIAQD